MNTWRDNFIGNMYGPHFLVFYVIVILVVLVLVRWWVCSADHTLEERLEDPPEPADPMDLALLRGDVNEVLRLIVVELVQRGYLQVKEHRSFGLTTSQKIAQVTKPPEVYHLGPLHRGVFEFFRSPKDASELFSDSSLSEWVSTRCLIGTQRLQEQRLLTPADVAHKGITTGIMAGVTVLGLGGFKLAIALSKGMTNVVFLIVLGIIGTVAVILASRPPRISRRGRAYLQHLQQRYAGLKSRITSVTQAVDDSGLAFAVALFGVSVLEGTPYAGLASSFRRATSASGCGGASCGGGGCGGGGCGGGGCGGCGGG